jgi:hypothetical protein
MKATIGKTSEKFAANLEQLKKESATQIKRSFDSISTLKVEAVFETERENRFCGAAAFGFRGFAELAGGQTYSGI